MENFILEVHAGDNFTETSKVAQKISNARSGQNVEFVFNCITCVVSRETNLELLQRDYNNADIMEWTTVGPDCIEIYSPELQAEIAEKERAQEEEQRKWHEKWEKEEQDKKAKFLQKIEDVELELSDPNYLAEQERINDDPYGGRCVSYAKEWARLMQKEIADGKPLSEIAAKTSHEADYDGITGFMYGAAVHILSKSWKHGEELRIWHNKQYGKEEGEGVVNPAVITIS